MCEVCWEPMVQLQADAPCESMSTTRNYTRRVELSRNKPSRSVWYGVLWRGIMDANTVRHIGRITFLLLVTSSIPSV